MAKCSKCGGVLVVEWTYSWRKHLIRCLTLKCPFRKNEGDAESPREIAWWKECVRHWDKARFDIEESVAAAQPDYPEEEA